MNTRRFPPLALATGAKRSRTPFGSVRTLAAPMLGAQGAERLEAALLDLEAADSVASLMELTVPAT